MLSQTHLIKQNILYLVVKLGHCCYHKQLLGILGDYCHEQIPNARIATLKRRVPATSSVLYKSLQ